MKSQQITTNGKGIDKTTVLKRRRTRKKASNTKLIPKFDIYSPNATLQDIISKKINLLKKRKLKRRKVNFYKNKMKLRLNN